MIQRIDGGSAPCIRISFSGALRCVPAKGVCPKPAGIRACGSKGRVRTRGKAFPLTKERKERGAGGWLFAGGPLLDAALRPEGKTLAGLDAATWGKGNMIIYTSCEAVRNADIITVILGLAKC